MVNPCDNLNELAVNRRWNEVFRCLNISSNATIPWTRIKDVRLDSEDAVIERYKANLQLLRYGVLIIDIIKYIILVGILYYVVLIGMHCMQRMVDMLMEKFAIFIVRVHRELVKLDKPKTKTRGTNTEHPAQFNYQWNERK